MTDLPLRDSALLICHTDGVTRALLPTLDTAEETLRSHGCHIQAEAVHHALALLRHVCDTCGARFDHPSVLLVHQEEAHGA